MTCDSSLLSFCSPRPRATATLKKVRMRRGADVITCILLVLGMASSSNSPQYKAVLSHLEALTTTLRVTPGAESSLLQKFQELSWLAIGAKASAKELVTLALNRIENDVKDYEVFTNMLGTIPGMKTVVDKVAGTVDRSFLLKCAVVCDDIVLILHCCIYCVYI